jgi:hypothetical protein
LHEIPADLIDPASCNLSIESIDRSIDRLGLALLRGLAAWYKRIDHSVRGRIIYSGLVLLQGDLTGQSIFYLLFSPRTSRVILLLAPPKKLTTGEHFTCELPQVIMGQAAASLHTPFLSIPKSPTNHEKFHSLVDPSVGAKFTNEKRTVGPSNGGTSRFSVRAVR